MGKVVEIPADMTARDLCQLLVYKSHCVDDNSWALVEHHPLLGLGKRQSPAGPKHCSLTPNCTHEHTWSDTHAHSLAHTGPHRLLGGLRHAKQPLTYTGAYACMHACPHTWADRQFRHIFSRSYVFKRDCMHILYSILCTHRDTMFSDLIKYNTVAV